MTRKYITGHLHKTPIKRIGFQPLSQILPDLFFALPSLLWLSKRVLAGFDQPADVRIIPSDPTCPPNPDVRRGNKRLPLAFSYCFTHPDLRCFPASVHPRHRFEIKRSGERNFERRSA